MTVHLLRHLVPSCLVVAAALLGACGDDGDDGGHNEEEVITTVILSFTPSGGGAALTFEFDDPDGDGGGAPTVDPIVLAAGTYTTTVGFENRLETPPEVITTEVNDESDQHQVFFTGTAVDGPASNHPGAPLTHTYSDTDVNGLPIGLSNSIVAAAGTGNLSVLLQHMPPVNDVAVKVTGLAGQVRDSGDVDALPGEHDANVTFSVTVN